VNDDKTYLESFETIGTTSKHASSFIVTLAVLESGTGDQLPVANLVPGNEVELCLPHPAGPADATAVLQAWKKNNPGKNSMEWGGEESQRYFDAVAATPSEAPKVDRFTCLFCKKASAERLTRCSRCERAYFCNAECFRAAWKQHKKVCQPVEGYSTKRKKKKATLTWDQLEKHYPMPVEGRTLEVRIMLDESLMRLVVKAKDREGVVCKIAAYTDSGQIPGCVPGAVMKWKHPKFHYFMDGSSGCRIEQDDLSNITFGD
jgi:hypothetical protein